jgi:tRNA pseudouridine38-40 synthase
MFRYQILIEYVGTSFRGWQIQKKGKTIQGLIQEKISKLLKQKITLYGSGRTDTGVHAIEQSAHFDSKNRLLQTNRFLKSINHFLNKEGVTILKIKKRNNNFHARFSAKMRIYKYVIINRLSGPVLDKDKGWHVMKKLDLATMKKGAKKLIGTKDFSTFRASSCRAKSPIKTMKFVRIKSSKNKIEIEFRSQSFLQQQVRSMVGCLKYLGENKWSLKKFESIMKSKKRVLCAPPAPPEGLFLSRVIY